jgi:hypothetical protein
MELAPGRNFSILEDGAVRFDDGDAPVTQAQIEAKAEELVSVIETERVKSMRQAAYRAESDPLFFQYQRGEATEAEWLAKVNEIKERIK